MKLPNEINALQIGYWKYLIYSEQSVTMVPGYPDDIFWNIQVIDTQSKTSEDIKTVEQLEEIEKGMVCPSYPTPKDVKLYFWFLKKLLKGEWKFNYCGEDEDEETAVQYNRASLVAN